MFKKEKENGGELAVSFVLPVYNVEEYLERCIRSLEDQDLSRNEFEIIVVNDGSPDNSRDVVLQLMNEFNNIVFIEQENKGVSMARNAGIDKAKGRYILFVDPDDYVLPNSVKLIIESADADKSQLTFLAYRILDVHAKTVGEVFNADFTGKIYSGIEAYPLSRGDGKLDPDRSWGILFEHHFMTSNNLRYLSQIPYLEDGEFLARVMCLAERTSFSARPFYIRTTRIGSATNSNLFFQDKSVNGFIRAAINLSNFRKQNSLNLHQRKFLNQPICKFVLLSLSPYTSLSRISQFNSIVKKIQEARFKRLDLNGCNNYYKIEGSFYNFSPYLFFLHRMLRAPLLKLVNP